MAVLEQRGLTTSRDRTGGISLVKKWIVDTLEETLTVGDRTMLGMPEDSRTSHQLEGGKGRHVVLITYKGVEVETSPDNERWSGELKFREDPIETHPFLDELLARYEARLRRAGLCGRSFFPGAGRRPAVGSLALRKRSRQ
ncbi:hypothetical protein [Verrucomicrobium spinosum]|uniref:hypothetical protein n=1 Tax=Verrucomicrobium spinosum TaxID=2736 RepID=UPI0009466A98|nr:hypothetical protein [Verrucomicrobium spinosum]